MINLHIIKAGAIIIIALLKLTLYAQAPKWIISEHRNITYPDKEFLKGFSEYKNQDKLTQEIFLEILKDYAQKELVQSVRTTIETSSILRVKEEGDAFSELFMMSSVSTSGMSISGLKFKTHYDKKSKNGYAFAYANRNEVIEFYKGNLRRSKNIIQQKLELAKGLINQQSKQLKQLNSCYPEYRNVEEAQSIMFALNTHINDRDLLLQEFKNLKIEVENLKDKIENSIANDINEVAVLLAFVLKNQLQDENIKSIRMLNLSYQDTKMGSSFSRRFSKTLEQKLSSEAGINVISNVRNKEQEVLINKLYGTYWEEGNSLRIILVLKNPLQNKTLASAEAKLSLDWLTSNGINHKPENFQQAYSNMKAFKTNELTGGGLLAEIWTNKGEENLIYTEGDLLKLFVRVNRECFLRVIYHLANGSRVQLVDNYYISSDKINTVYELPYEFECSKPYGVETLQLNVQTQAFDPLNIEYNDGYEFIIDDLNEILVNTRGFRKKTKGVKKAEKRVVITTMYE